MVLPHLLLGRQPTTTISSTDRSNQRTASGPRECSPCAVFVSSRERVRSCPHAREPPCPPRRLKKLGRNSCRGCSHGFCRAQHALVHSARARGLRTKLPRSAEDSCGESLETSASNSCTAMIATPTTMEVSRSMRAVCLRIRCIDQQRGVVSRSAELTFRYLGESSDCGLLRSK